jgi:protein TonB
MKETLGQAPVVQTQAALTLASTLADKSPARRGSLLAAFTIGSCLVHGVAYAALQGLPSDPAAAAPSLEVAFAVLAAPAPPEPEPMVEPPPPRPVAKPMAPPRPKAMSPAPKPDEPVPAPPEAPPALATLGVSEDEGLSVAGEVGPATPLAGTSLTGSPAGQIGGTGRAPVTAPASRANLSALASAWMTDVKAVIISRAQRDYPRSAKRARLQGSLMIQVHVDIRGRVREVTLARSSGHPQLDEAALASVRGLGTLPEPPEALRGYLRPIPIPINYRLQ